MKKIIVFLLASACLLGLIGCSEKHEAVKDKWDCSVVAAESNTADAYVITYCEEEITSMTGQLTFQNRNDFAIVVHLLSDGAEEVLDIHAGGVLCHKRIDKEKIYTVGIHADVIEGTDIELMVYDGEKAEAY